jgi:hypothetical protein
MNIKAHQFLLNTFVEINKCLGFGVENQIRKELFQQQLIKEQKKEERDNFTTKKEFLTMCLLSHIKLKDYVFSETETDTLFPENIRNSVVLNHFIRYPTPISSEQVQTEIDNFDVNNYLVSVSEFINKPRTYISNNDILFIGDCIATLSFEENQKSKVKDRKDTSPLIILEKTIFDFIKNVKNKELFIQDLKIKFPTEKGKKIKAIIDYLEENNVLDIPDGDFTSFHCVLSQYFERNIGTRQGIIKCSLNYSADKKLLDSTETKLKPLIDKYKKQ